MIEIKNSAGDTLASAATLDGAIDQLLELIGHQEVTITGLHESLNELVEMEPDVTGIAPGQPLMGFLDGWKALRERVKEMSA